MVQCCVHSKFWFAREIKRAWRRGLVRDLCTRTTSRKCTARGAYDVFSRIDSSCTLRHIWLARFAHQQKNRPPWMDMYISIQTYVVPYYFSWRMLFRSCRTCSTQSVRPSNYDSSCCIRIISRRYPCWRKSICTMKVSINIHHMRMKPPSIFGLFHQL